MTPGEIAAIPVLSTFDPYAIKRFWTHEDWIALYSFNPSAAVTFDDGYTLHDEAIAEAAHRAAEGGTQITDNPWLKVESCLGQRNANLWLSAYIGKREAMAASSRD